jgi:ssDNA-binding Zn-finger/Zn-ribbon topoisomerase 1
MAKRPPHIHKYMRVLWGKNQTPVMRCVIPDCSHYIHMEMAVNRRSICWKCGAPFVMDKVATTRKKPKCSNCAHKGDPVISRLDGLLEGLE